MARKTAFTELKNKHEMVRTYVSAYENAKTGGVVPGTHSLVAMVFEEQAKLSQDDVKARLLGAAEDARTADEAPRMDLALPIFRKGYEIFNKQFSDYSITHLEEVVNSKNLGRKKVKNALLMIGPKENVIGHKPRVKLHREASQVYTNMALYQSDQVSASQKASILHNMKVGIAKDYEADFKDDKEFLMSLVSYIQGHESITLAQYGRIVKDKVAKFNKGMVGRIGGYVNAALSSEGRSRFCETILSEQDSGLAIAA